MDVNQPIGIGTDFLGYRIEERIGRGGMGVVYRAYDRRLKRTVALKLVAPSLARDEQFRERFARESELVMSLEHPNVVPIHDAGDADGLVYLAMRLVDGTDLGSLLRTEGALEPARAMAICKQIASALDAAHQRGLVHRDVKPSNVLLDSSDHVYLADFGLTRRLDDEAGRLSEDGTFGTPAYLAPEQLEGNPVDGRADVYSLGCLFYECLTGEPVFPRDTRLAVAWAHLEEEPPSASARRPELPEAIDQVIRTAMAKEPDQRFATCGGLIAAGEQALGLAKTDPSRLRRPLLLGGAIAIVIAIAGVVAVTTLHLRSNDNPLPAVASANQALLERRGSVHRHGYNGPVQLLPGRVRTDALGMKASFEVFAGWFGEQGQGGLTLGKYRSEPFGYDVDTSRGGIEVNALDSPLARTARRLEALPGIHIDDVSPVRLGRHSGRRYSFHLNHFLTFGGCCGLGRSENDVILLGVGHRTIVIRKMADPWDVDAADADQTLSEAERVIQSFRFQPNDG